MENELFKANSINQNTSQAEEKKEVKKKRFIGEDLNRKDYQSNTLKNIVFSMKENDLLNLLKLIIKNKKKYTSSGMYSVTFDFSIYSYHIEDFLYYLKYLFYY